jgi:DNA-binding MarR family transcriptional regulator
VPAPSATADTVETDTAARLRATIGRLSRRLRPTAAGTAAGLTPTRVTVLLDVVRRERARLADVASAEGINPTMLSRVIADLVEAGLVERASDERDRRTVWVKPTAAGRRLAERMRRERTDAVNLALEGLTETERAMVRRALPALEALAEQLGSERR